jgi:transcriptional regulator with XRE-family HTH domain
MNHFAKNLRFLRTKANFTQEEFAEKLGFTRSAIASYEEERAMASFEKISKIADFFGITLDDILRADLENCPKILHKAIIVKDKEGNTYLIPETLANNFGLDCERAYDTEDFGFLKYYRNNFAIANDPEIYAFFENGLF